MDWVHVHIFPATVYGPTNSYLSLYQQKGRGIRAQILAESEVIIYVNKAL